MSEIYQALMPVVERPEIDLEETAVVIIDMQKMDAHRDHGFGAKLTKHGVAHLAEEYFSRIENVALPNQVKLVQAARKAEVPVIFVRVAASCGSEDANLQYRLWGIVPRTDEVEAELLSELGPFDNDVIVNKVATSAFNGSMIERVLWNRGVTRLILGGVNTNNCVEMTARDAIDRGFWVDVVEDSCAALAGTEAHESAISRLNFGLSRVVTTEHVIKEMDRSAKQ